MYDLKKEIEEMEHITDEQKERLKQAHEILKQLHSEITYNYHEHNVTQTSMWAIEKHLK